MSGEWDVFYQYYGYLGGLTDYQDILTIMQEGNKFLAVKQIGNEFAPKGSETIRSDYREIGLKLVR
jgi:hypothetical protein